MTEISSRFHGFYQAGRATLEGTLQSIYATQPEAYAVRSLLTARSAEEAQATFRVSFSFAIGLQDVGKPQIYTTSNNI